MYHTETEQEAQLLLGWPTVLSSHKTNHNPNPNIAGPVRVRQCLSTHHSGGTGHNLAKNRYFLLKRAHYEAK